MADLEDKVAVITGASSGIGRASALALAAEGAIVAVLGRKASAIEEVVAEIEASGGRAMGRVVDVRDEVQVAALMDDVVRDFGRVDIMINNAGVSYPGGITSGKVSQWRDILETNLLGMLIGCREAVRVMLPNHSGQIVNMSSGTTRFLRDTGQVYTGAKHAMNYITAGLREELIETGIRVTVVIPGLTLTNISRNAPQQVLEDRARAAGIDPASAGIRSGAYFAEQLEGILDAQPGVYLSADDVARAVVYAVSQPPHVQVEEVVVRPSLGLSGPRTFHDR